MKRLLKLIALSLVMIVICASFTGCERIVKDLEDRQVIQLDNGDLRYKGNDYRPLPGGDYMINASYDIKNLFISNENIPLLLSIFEDSHMLYASKDGKFINYSFFPDEELGYDDYVEIEYCRADLYDSVVERISNGIEYTTYGYCYYVDIDDAIMEYYYLTDWEAKVVDTVLKKVTPTVLPSADYIDYDFLAFTYAYSEDKVFCKYAFEICRYGNDFYVVDDSEANPLVYKVPWNLVPEFEKIIQTALERAEVPEY